MPRKRDPNFHTGHLCRFCGELVPWGTILRLIRVDPDTPGYMLNESACHTECLRRVLRPDVPLDFHRYWTGGTPMLDDDADIDGKPCAMCARNIAPAGPRPHPRPETRRTGQTPRVRRVQLPRPLRLPRRREHIAAVLAQPSLSPVHGSYFRTHALIP
jgi:hypothetical protein